MTGDAEYFTERHAREALAAAEDAGRRMSRLRQLHGSFPQLTVWGVVLVAGNTACHFLERARAGHGMIALWLGLVGAGIVVSGLIEWRLRLRTIELWRLLGLMLLLFAQGWMVFRIVSPWSGAQGAVYVTGLVLFGWSIATLLHKARGWFCFSVILLMLAYAGYSLFNHPAALYVWLAGVIGGGMLLAALVTAVWERRLMNPARGRGAAA